MINGINVPPSTRPAESVQVNRSQAVPKPPSESGKTQQNSSPTFRVSSLSELLSQPSNTFGTRPLPIIKTDLSTSFNAALRTTGLDSSTADQVSLTQQHASSAFEVGPNGQVTVNANSPHASSVMSTIMNDASPCSGCPGGKCEGCGTTSGSKTSTEAKESAQNFGMQLAGMMDKGNATAESTAKVLNAMANLSEGEAAHAFSKIAQEKPDTAAQVLNVMVAQDTKAAAKMVAKAVTEGAQAVKESVSNIVAKSPENAGKLMAQVANTAPKAAAQLLSHVADAFFDSPSVLQSTIATMAKGVNAFGTQAIAQFVADNPGKADVIMGALQQANPEVAQSVQNAADSISAVRQFNAPKEGPQTINAQQQNGGSQVLEFNGQVLSRPAEQGAQQTGATQSMGAQGLPANLSAIANAKPGDVAGQLLSLSQTNVTQAATTLAALVTFGQAGKAATAMAALVANGNLAQGATLISVMLSQGNAKEVGLLFNAMVNQGQVKELSNPVQFMVNNGQTADAALAIANMNVGAAVQLFSSLPPQTGAQIMAQMVAQGSTAQAAMIMGQMVAQGSTVQAANILAAMPPKDAAAVLFQMASTNPKAMLSILVAMAQSNPKQALAILELLMTMNLPKDLKQQLQAILNAIKDGKVSELDLAKMIDELDPALLAAVAAAMSDEEENMKLERKLQAKKAKEDAENQGDGGEAMLQSLQQFDEKLATAYAFGLKKKKEKERI